MKNASFNNWENTQSQLSVFQSNWKNKKPSSRWDSRPYCLTAYYL